MQSFKHLHLIIAITGTIYSSMSQDLEWKAITPELSGGTVSTLMKGYSGDVFAQKGHYVARTTDDGATWTSVSPPLISLFDLDLNREMATFRTSAGTGLILYSPGGEFLSLLRSLDNGSSWDTIPLNPNLSTTQLTIVGLPDGKLAAVTQTSITYKHTLLTSSDHGITWTQEHQLPSGAESVLSSTDGNIYIIEGNGSGFHCRTSSGELLVNSKPPNIFGYQRFCAAGSRVYISNDSDLYYSDDRGGSWYRAFVPTTSTSFDHLVGFPDKSVLIVAPLRFNSSRIYYLNKDSIHARLIQDSTPYRASGSISVGSRELLAPSPGFVTHAYELGEHWSVRTEGIKLVRPVRVTSQRGSALLLGDGGKVYHYHPSFASWVIVSTLPFEHDPAAITNVLMTQQGTYLVFTTSGVIRSTDSATTWQSVPTADSLLRSKYAFQSKHGSILASAESWLWESTDDGETWFRRAYQYKANITSIGETPDSVLLVCSRHGLNKIVDTELYFLERTSWPANSVLTNAVDKSIFGVAALSVDRQSFELHRTSDAGYSWRSHVFGLPATDYTANFTACSDEFGTVYFTSGTFSGEVTSDTSIRLRRSTLLDAVLAYAGLANGRIIRCTMSRVEELNRPSSVMNDLPEPSDLQIAPNPASDVAHLEGLHDGPVTVNIYDLMGRLVRSTSVTAQNARATLPINEIPSGTHLLTTSGKKPILFIVK
ncbi:MAG TPA: T9SS type A sorting domain-containing protein [Candidatus Didemnitutus sp.]|nr:T9SS type A sorting domain-containing protein [Candidatus Didemnitutus sp.]